MAGEEIRIDDESLNAWRRQIEEVPQVSHRYKEEDFAGYSEPGRCPSDADPQKRHAFYHVSNEVQIIPLMECAHCQTVYD